MNSRSVTANADYIKGFVQQKGLSDRQFALILGMSPATISRIISGNRGVGSMFIGLVMQKFPDFDVKKAFFLDYELPNGNGDVHETA